MNEQTTERQLRDHHLNKVRDMLKGDTHLRSYAFSPQHWIAVAALNRAAAIHSDDTTTLVERFKNALAAMEAHTPHLYRPVLEEPRLPTPLKDPLTGEIVRLPASQTERAKLAKYRPDYYDYLVKLEKSPISALMEHDEARAKWMQRKTFYSNYDHSTNPFTGNSPEHHARQNLVAKNDPDAAALLMAEARPPAAFPWDSSSPNHTALAKIAKTNQPLAEMLKDAREICARWSNIEAAEEEEKVRAMVAALQARGVLPAGYPARHAVQRKDSERKPMKHLAKLGSAEQARRQHEAAAANAADKPLSGAEHEKMRISTLEKLVGGDNRTVGK